MTVTKLRRNVWLTRLVHFFNFVPSWYYIFAELAFQLKTFVAVWSTRSPVLFSFFAPIKFCYN
jgi:hypothetical protein